VLYTRLVYPKLREALGGRIRYAISGSSKLQVGTARFFTNIGVPVYEGYGLTEASPVITANGPGRRRVGTVGLPLSGVEVRIAPDGEILARGPNTMLGYHNSPQATGEVLDGDGWLHTGDLGSVDVDGYLTLTGRKKELFKKSTGEYVPPGPIEYALSRIPYVDTGVIVADGRVYVTALLFPDLDRLNGFKSKFGLSDMSAHEFLRSDFLRRKTQEYVDEVNAHRHHCERIERFHILDHPASIETGELTPSLKVRRFHVEEIYKAAIDNMYASIGGWK
jgi:long-chain acyl-CoA synthetase